LFRGKKKGDEVVKEEVLDVNLERGVVTRKVDGTRVIALGSRGWATMEKELQTTFITGAAVILQRLGYSYGRAMGRAARSQGMPPEQTFEIIQTLARESGWGMLSLNGGDLFGGEARITVRDCFFCLHVPESTEPVCHVLVGLVGGMADEIIGSSHRVTEEKCIARGDSVCEILIERLG
jgi:predicted hydrocarbon binding protein